MQFIHISQTFGYGIHACLGAPLARLEGKIALERIVACFSKLRPDLESPVQFEEGGRQLFQHLTLLFTPASS